MDYLVFGQTRNVGSWQYKRNLGSGGFGNVSLWRHERSGEEIALKRCKHEEALTPKQKERWATEVVILGKLMHPNVIKGLQVPQAFLPSSKIPPLAMEYCAGGDLRKVLSTPKNSCGLPEFEVLTILKDISSALEYLHIGQHIVHRDVKPENIVLKCDDRRVIYKLIDLGYAKELSDTSCFTSFVGTIQYLAPELFLEAGSYSHSVDYWSFGTLIFECLCGFRPFLPTLTPIQWHAIVQKKEFQHICAMGNGHNFKFSANLPANNLCSILQPWMENFLRLVLNWDQVQRGWDPGLSAASRVREKRATFFKHLDDMFRKKILAVYVFCSNTLVHYELATTDATVSQLREFLHSATGIVPTDQEIINPKGHPVKCDSEVLLPFWHDPIAVADNSPHLFVFDSSLLLKKELSSQSASLTRIPGLVQNLLRTSTSSDDSDQLRTASYEKIKRNWASCIGFLQRLSVNYLHLCLAFRAYKKSLNSQVRKCRTSYKRAVDSRTRLSTTVAFAQFSLKDDIESYYAQANVKDQGISSKKLIDRWENKDMKQINQYKNLLEDFKEENFTKDLLSAEIADLSQTPARITTALSPCYPDRVDKSELHVFIEEAEAKFDSLKTALRSDRYSFERSTSNSQTAFYDNVRQCIVANQDQFRDLHGFIRKMAHAKAGTLRKSEELADFTSKYNDARLQIEELQRKRQLEVWGLLGVALKHTSKLKQRISSTTSQQHTGSSTTRVPTSDNTDQMHFTSPPLLVSQHSAAPLLAHSISNSSGNLDSGSFLQSLSSRVRQSAELSSKLSGECATLTRLIPSEFHVNLPGTATATSISTATSKLDSPSNLYALQKDSSGLNLLQADQQPVKSYDSLDGSADVFNKTTGSSGVYCSASVFSASCRTNEDDRWELLSVDSSATNPNVCATTILSNMGTLLNNTDGK